jgi:phage terminase small subunit
VKGEKPNPKQQLFIKEYLVDLNGAEAAKRAGYQQKRAREVAYQLLKKPHIKRAIDEALKARGDKIDTRAQDVIQRLRDIAFADLAEAFDGEGQPLPVPKMPKHLRLALSSVKASTIYAQGVDIGEKLEIRLSDRIKALELLGKHLGLFSEQIFFINGKRYTAQQLLDERALEMSQKGDE